MATIIEPAATRAIAVRTRQPLTLVSDSATNWWTRTNGGAWSQIGTSQSLLIWVTPSSVIRRFTFDYLQIIAQDTSPGAGDMGGLHLNLCDGPASVLHMTDSLRNEAMEPPPARPDEFEHDDPPFGLPLLMPAANRDGLGTSLRESVAEPGGPANLVGSWYGPGLFTDTAGHVGSRTPIASKVQGLAPFPQISSFHHGNSYFNQDFGKSRTLSLTRTLFEEGTAPQDVAVVCGDGRRNMYRDAGGGTYTPAASLENTLAKTAGKFKETLPSGTEYHFNTATGSGVAKASVDKLTDRYGNATYFGYDSNSRLQKIQGPPGTSGMVPYLQYDSNGLCSAVTLQDQANPAGDRSAYLRYDANKNLTDIIGPEGCQTYFEYDGAGKHIVRRRDAENFNWLLAYDANDRVEKLVDPENKSTYFAFDTATPLTTMKDRAATSTYFKFNAFGSPTTVFNPGTPADYHGYDGEGNLTSSKNRLGRQWTKEYDGRGNRISSTDPLGARSYFAFDGQDLLKTYIDPLNRSTYLEFDGSRNRTLQKDPAGNTVTWGYQSTGLLHFAKDRRGAFTYWAFDAKANNTATEDPLGFMTYFDHNSAGERTAMVDPEDRVSYWTRDKRGRVTEAKDPVGATRLFAYDSRCNLVTEVDPRNKSTYHSYDGNSNRTRSIDALGNPSYWGYDAEERVASQKNARLFESQWAYDLLGRREKQVDALGGTTYWAYDDAHEVTRLLDPRSNATYMAYDETGRPQKQKDAYLNETYHGYDLNGNRVLMLDQRSKPAYFSYDSRDWLTQSKNAIFATTVHEYDEEQNRTKTVDPLGNATYFAFDLRRLQTHTKDALFSISYMGYDKARQLVLRLDELNAPTYMRYDGPGRQMHVKDAYLNQTYMGYDLSGNAVVFVDELGFATYHTYDDIDRRTRTKDAYSNIETTVYDRVGNVEQQINKRGSCWYYTYDALDRRTHEKDPVHFASTYHGFDPVGNHVLMGDQLGFGTYYTFDRLNRQESVRDPAQLRTYHAYDAASNRLEIRVEQGWGRQPWGSSPYGGERRSTYMEYDAINRTTKVIDALAGERVHVYDDANNKTRDIDQEGRPTYFTLDRLNREQTRKNLFDDTWTNAYDERGSVTRRIDAEGRATYMEFDLKVRQIKQSNSLGEVAYWGHDARSSRVLFTNPRNFSTYFTYDRLARQETQKDALNGVRYFGYDEDGNRVLDTDELFNPTYYRYDRLDRMTFAIDATLAETYIGYDARSSLIRGTDADGRWTYFSYDGARRMSAQMPTTDPWMYYAYDAVGNLTIIRDETGSNVNAFDKFDRLLSKTTLAGTVYYAYDKAGLKARFKDPDFTESYFGYDAAGRLRHVQLLDSPQRAQYYEYDRSGLPTKKASPQNQVLSYYTYDNAGRLKQMKALDSGAAIVTYFAYVRNGNGVVEKITREGGLNFYYTFDALERLIHEEHAGALGASFGNYYSYDAASNRALKHDTASLDHPTTYYTYDSRNLLTKEFMLSVDIQQTNYFTHDNCQRMTSDFVRSTESGRREATYYGYNLRNMIQLIQHEKEGGGADSPRYFTYNGVGERVVVKNDGTPNLAYWAYDGSRLVLEKSTGGLVRKYRHNRMWLPAQVHGSLVEVQDAEAGKASPVFDERASIIRLVGADTGTDSFEYDWFGVRGEATDNVGQRNGFFSPLFVRIKTAQDLSLVGETIYVTRLGLSLVGGSRTPFITAIWEWLRQMHEEALDDAQFGSGWWGQFEPPYYRPRLRSYSDFLLELALASRPSWWRRLFGRSGLSGAGGQVAQAGGGQVPPGGAGQVPPPLGGGGIVGQVGGGKAPATSCPPAADLAQKANDYWTKEPHRSLLTLALGCGKCGSSDTYSWFVARSNRGEVSLLDLTPEAKKALAGGKTLKPDEIEDFLRKLGADKLIAPEIFPLTATTRAKVSADATTGGYELYEARGRCHAEVNVAQAMKESSCSDVQIGISQNACPECSSFLTKVGFAFAPGGGLPSTSTSANCKESWRPGDYNSAADLGLGVYPPQGDLRKYKADDWTQPKAPPGYGTP